MPAIAKSQWDFSGELFPPEATRRVFTVAELTGDIRRLLEKHLGQVWVGGEITNCRTQSSGHTYFTLKDAAAQISCIVFRSDPVAGREALADGRRVVLKGELSVYEARGQYQLHVLAIELQGVGALQAAFEKLKQKLAAEGLFDPQRKRPLPRFPQRVGLVTSATGAALRDVWHVIERRNPTLQLILTPCAVQGPGAASEIAAGIRLLNQWSARPGSGLDVILVTRGGGSLEDLWAFNEEAVARAIFHSAVPVVSAVGHEIDFTISDFVADVRAATPSAAAEILTEGVLTACRWMGQARQAMHDRVARRLAMEQRHCHQLAQRVRALHPRRRLNQQLQRIDDLQGALVRHVRQGLQERRRAVRNAQLRLGRLRPRQLVARRAESLSQLRRRLREQLRHTVHQLRSRSEAAAARLRLLGPEQVLARGYSITVDAATGEIIRDSAQAPMGKKIRSRLHKGSLASTVDET